jgi:NADH:ubiquinone oxidoreductase subunit H
MPTWLFFTRILSFIFSTIAWTAIPLENIALADFNIGILYIFGKLDMDQQVE